MGSSRKDSEDLAWADALVVAGFKTQDNQPLGEGWLTMMEVIATSPYGETKTRKVVREAMERGEIEVHAGTQYIEKYKRSVRGVWYRWKTKQKQKP